MDDFFSFLGKGTKKKSFLISAQCTHVVLIYANFRKSENSNLTIISFRKFAVRTYSYALNPDQF